MGSLYRFLFPFMWISWAAYWWISSLNAKAAIRRESIISRLIYAGTLAVAIFLIWGPVVPYLRFGARFLPSASWPFWAGSLLTACGLLFSVWARRHLGRNWSGAITIKRDHELITSGPYALVRHPIYSGLLLAFVGSVTARGEFRGIPAIGLVFWALWTKIRHEERWMREHFGEAYRQYCRHVAALIPCVF